jgi:hypothetical protein
MRSFVEAELFTGKRLSDEIKRSFEDTRERPEQSNSRLHGARNGVAYGLESVKLS